MSATRRSGAKLFLYAVLPAPTRGGTTHYLGLPPELNAGEDGRQLLPATRVMIAEPDDGEAYLLLRYSAEGDFAGDTWHETLAALKDQAAFEFEGGVEWRVVPRDVDDALRYVLTTMGSPR